MRQQTRHVFKGTVSLCQWIKDLGTTNSYALWYWKDLKPTVAQYFYFLKKLIKRHGV